MAGHNKWSKIKRSKGALDAKRSKLFTKLIKEITVSVRENGPDPEANPRLRLAIQNSKAANMPKDNIERAISKGAGTDGENYTEVSYEGYATNGVAVFVEALTDNTNRTYQNVRTAFKKHGGSLGANGSLEFIFDRKGVFSIKPGEEKLDEEEFSLEMIDAGAEEIEFDDDYVTVYCAMEDFGNLQKKTEEMGLDVEVAELQRIPKTTVSLDSESIVKILKLIDMLEDDDDVQKVYHNMDITDEQLEEIGEQ